MSRTASVQAGGACPKHGLYVGYVCPICQGDARRLIGEPPGPDDPPSHDGFDQQDDGTEGC